MNSTNKKEQIINFDEEYQSEDPISFKKEGETVKATGSLNATARTVFGIGSNQKKDQAILRNIVEKVVDILRRKALSFEFNVTTILMDRMFKELKVVIMLMEKKIAKEGKSIKIKDPVDGKYVSTVDMQGILEGFLARFKGAVETLSVAADAFSKDIDLDEVPKDAKFVALLNKFGGQE